MRRSMKFTKMHGCGNDYIYVDGAKEQIAKERKPELVRRLSDRHFGIGGDGVIFINPGREADFEMEMYNADGTRAEMCGNGIRSVAKYVYDKGLTDKKNITIESCGKVKYLELTVTGERDEAEGTVLSTAASGPAGAKPRRGEVSQVRVNMGSPILQPAQIPVTLEGESAVNVPITVEGREYRMTCVSMGNPHAVIFAEGVADLPLEKIGPLFEKHPCFPNRTNTEFVEVLNRNTVFMRVWERGTGETLACGTGCCATAVACVLNGLTQEDITVKVLGGELRICWNREENFVYMTGPAVTVFEGEIDI